MTTDHRPKLTIQIVITLIAALSLLAILWSGWAMVMQPDLGVLWTDGGSVYFARPGSPIQVGDRLLTIDDLSLSESGFPYYHWQKGDMVRVGLERGGESLTLEIPYDDPAPPVILASRLSIMIVVLALWGIGSGVALYSPSAGRQSLLFFLWCQALAVALALGSVTSQALERTPVIGADVVGDCLCHSFPPVVSYQPYCAG